MTPLPSVNMTKHEVVAILGMLGDGKAMFEWGSGQSTILFSQWCKRYVSVEDNSEWGDKVRQKLVTFNVDLRFAFHPEDYVEALDDDGYDIILVDGSYRVACARKAAEIISSPTLVLVHDWDREEYHEILDTYKIRWVVDTLAILEKR